MQITDNIKTILSSAKLDEQQKTITLTGQLDRKDYVTVNEILNTIGFTWNKKLKTHVGTDSPGQAIKAILQPASNTFTIVTARELKKKNQIFYTPCTLADRMVELANIQDGDSILEPSAGMGAIVRAIHRAHRHLLIDICEVDYQAIERFLNGVREFYPDVFPYIGILGKDFLQCLPSEKYDRIIMNPPYSKHQDIQHIQHAYKFLKKGGIMVALCSNHSFFASHKVDVAFREWLSGLDYSEEDIEAGSFKESGTMIPVKLLVIDK